MSRTAALVGFFHIYAFSKFPRHLHQNRVFAVNTHPLKAFLTKKRNSLAKGEMFMVKTKNPAPPTHDCSLQDASPDN
jgi:hypothetical protein